MAEQGVSDRAGKDGIARGHIARQGTMIEQKVNGRARGQ